MKDMINLRNSENTELRVIRLDKSGDISIVYNPNEPGLYGIVIGRSHPVVYFNSDIISKIAKLPVDPLELARMTEVEAEQMGIVNRELEYFRRINMIITTPVNKPEETKKEDYSKKPDLSINPLTEEAKPEKPAKKRGKK